MFEAVALKNIKSCDLSVATKCMFHCKMCYNWENKKYNSKIMDIADWKQLLEKLSQIYNHDFKVIFSGPGEVLQREGIQDLLFKACQKFKIVLITNGFLIDKQMACVLCQTVNCLTLSLDGFNSHTHDFLRGMPGAHKQVLAAIKKIRENSSRHLSITVNTVILAQNIDELIPLVNWIDKEEDINGIIFQAVTMPFNLSFDENWYKNNYSFLWPKDPKIVNRVLEELILLKKSGSKIINSIKQLLCFKAYFSHPKRKIETLKCEADKVLKVDFCGNIRICDFSEPVGNVRDASIVQIWNSELAHAQRKKAQNCNTACHLLINCFHEQDN